MDSYEKKAKAQDIYGNGTTEILYEKRKRERLLCLVRQKMPYA